MKKILFLILIVLLLGFSFYTINKGNNRQNSSNQHEEKTQG